MNSSSLEVTLPAPPGTVLDRAGAGFVGWRAWAAAAAAGLAALLLRPLLAPVLGEEATLVLAYPATVIAAWCGGFWPGAVVTLALALLMPALSPMPWDNATVGRVLIYLPFGLLISALSQSLHDARARLQRRADGLAVQALSEQRLATTLEGIGVALFELDAQLRCRWVCNAQALGLRAEDM
ncbi:MAG TPA: hypothetical protein VLU41_07060, partial [Ideonella sp.]|nr:hypothetical protein [Ideonella sp.]